MVYLAAQQQNKLIQFPVCANVGVLFTLDILSQACEKHIQTRFSLQQFRFWSITQPIMLCHVSVHSGAFCLRHRARDPISVAYFDRVALFSDFNHLFELLGQVLLSTAVVVPGLPSDNTQLLSCFRKLQALDGEVCKASFYCFLSHLTTKKVVICFAPVFHQMHCLIENINIFLRLFIIIHTKADHK